jgi:hypothetical protein
VKGQTNLRLRFNIPELTLQNNHSELTSRTHAYQRSQDLVTQMRVPAMIGINVLLLELHPIKLPTTSFKYHKIVCTFTEIPSPKLLRSVLGMKL